MNDTTKSLTTLLCSCLCMYIVCIYIYIYIQVLAEHTLSSQCTKKPPTLSTQVDRWVANELIALRSRGEGERERDRQICVCLILDKKHCQHMFNTHSTGKLSLPLLGNFVVAQRKWCIIKICIYLRNNNKYYRFLLHFFFFLSAYSVVHTVVFIAPCF